jgi:hypothetical protein
MSQIDQDKVKDVLHLVVESMYTMMDRNMYRDSVVSELHARIAQANLLTDQAPCATVKKQKQPRQGLFGVQVDKTT